MKQVTFLCFEKTAVVSFIGIWYVYFYLCMLNFFSASVNSKHTFYYPAPNYWERLWFLRNINDIQFSSKLQREKEKDCTQIILSSINSILFDSIKGRKKMSNFLCCECTNWKVCIVSVRVCVYTWNRNTIYGLVMHTPQTHAQTICLVGRDRK